MTTLQAVNKTLRSRLLFWPSVLIIAFAIADGIGGIVQDALVRAAASAFPPKHSWKPLSISSDGADGIVAGEMVKAWNCIYMPPPMAHDSIGRWYAVESASASSAQSWPARAAPYRFGPWRVIGAAGKEITFFHRDACYDVELHTRLGRVQFP